MAWLIVRLEPKENEGLPEQDRQPIVTQLVQRAQLGPVSMGAVEQLMTRNGFELGPVVGKMTGDWPLTAYVYTSTNPTGHGRSGSSFHRWPARRAS